MQRLDVNFASNFDNEIINKSLGPISTELLRQKNAEGAVVRDRQKYIDALFAIEDNDRKYTLFDEEISGFVLKNSAMPIKRLENAFNADFSGLLVNTQIGKLEITENILVERRQKLAEFLRT